MAEFVDFEDGKITAARNIGEDIFKLNRISGLALQHFNRALQFGFALIVKIFRRGDDAKCRRIVIVWEAYFAIIGNVCIKNKGARK